MCKIGKIEFGRIVEEKSGLRPQHICRNGLNKISSAIQHTMFMEAGLFYFIFLTRLNPPWLPSESGGKFLRTAPAGSNVGSTVAKRNWLTYVKCKSVTFFFFSLCPCLSLPPEFDHFFLIDSTFLW
jgi:hypothetical protein